VNDGGRLPAKETLCLPADTLFGKLNLSPPGW